MARSTDELQDEYIELTTMPAATEALGSNRNIPPPPAEALLYREVMKLQRFAGILLEEVLELRGRQD